MDGDLYDGLSVDRLPIDAVDVPDKTHLRRSARYRGAVDIEPEHAAEAVFDPRRLVARDPKPRTGEAMSPLRGRRITALVAFTTGRGTKMADKELLDRIAAAVEDAEATSDEELEWARHREPAKSPTAVYSVRIPVDRLEELRQLAADRGVQPTALIRAWVLAPTRCRAQPRGLRAALGT